MSVKPLGHSSVDDVSLLSDNDLKEYGLSRIQNERDSSRWCVWTAENKEIDRLVDARWVFSNEQDAKKWHLNNLGSNSENATPMKTDFVIGEEFRAYGNNQSLNSMLMSLGISMTMYCFLFCEGKYAAKVFMSGSKISMETAKKILEKTLENMKKAK